MRRSTAQLHTLVLLSISALLADCATSTAQRIDSAIAAYSVAAQTVELGASKEAVLPALEPTQSSLLVGQRKLPDRYVQGTLTVEIYYFRSGRQPDGLTTDDEFTPYMFVDGKLVSIGWAALGGPPTAARGAAVGTRPPSRGPQPGQTPSVAEDGKVYDAGECIGAIVNGRCRGTILPNKGYHPTCYGQWINGQCTGPLF